MLSLDAKKRVRALRRVIQGAFGSSTMAPQDVLRAAVVDRADTMLLVHNHPAGDPAPTPEDLGMTRRIDEAARAVGIRLLDHVIVCASGEHLSLLDLGVLEPR